MGSRSEVLAGLNGDTGGLSPSIPSECINAYKGTAIISSFITKIILVGQSHDSLKDIYSGCQRGA